MSQAQRLRPGTARTVTSPPGARHGADVVVSNDRRLRREINTLGEPLLAMTGDEFAQRLLVDHPDGIDAVIDALVAKRTLRPLTRAELIDQFAGSFPGFAARLRAQLPDRWPHKCAASPGDGLRP